MQRYTATIFLPRTDEVFGIYPHLLEELHLAKCMVLRAKDLTAFYAVGWHNGEIYQRGDLVDIYYAVSRLAELRDSAYACRSYRQATSRWSRSTGSLRGYSHPESLTSRSTGELSAKSGFCRGSFLFDRE